MLDKKYALQYQMPHTLLHIVDNSAYQNPLPQDVAEDPSLYSSIVVTATPMGIDNKIVNLSRADIASASFGLGSITADDVNRYGQSIEYPLSLIQNAKAPVQLLRVTPEGSTYAFVSLLVQWTVDEANKRFLVRFVPSSTVPDGIRLDRFKNTEKLNAELVKGMKTTVTSDGLVWNQEVFMNVIAAGRGKIYNDFAFAINFGKQSKLPSNCRYIFSTINTQTGLTVEEFAASLSNVTTSYSSKYYSTLDDVNTVVNGRMEGSSILIPYLNSNAVKRVYNDYTKKMEEFEKSGVLADYEISMLKSTNINIFDMVYGNYIYDGSQYDTKLPRYYVEMIDPEIKQLKKKDVFTTFVDKVDGAPNYDTTQPYPVWNTLYPLTYGVTNDKSIVYVGDTYVNSTYSNVEPYIDVVAAINQYTGAITSVSYKNVKAFGASGQTEDLKAIINVNVDVDAIYDYTLLEIATSDWSTNYNSYYTKEGNDYVPVQGVTNPTWTTDTYYSNDGSEYTLTTSAPDDWETNYANYYTRSGEEEPYTYTAVEGVAVHAPAFKTDTYYQLSTDISAANLPSAVKEEIDRLIKAGVITEGENPVAYTLSDKSVDIMNVRVAGGTYTVALNDKPGDVLSAINFDAQDKAAAKNIIATGTSDAAYAVPGYVYIDTTGTKSKVFVNGYNFKRDNGTDSGVRIEVFNNTNKFGTVEDSVNVDSELLGHEYDVVVYVIDDYSKKAVIKAGETGIIGTTTVYIPANTETPFGDETGISNNVGTNMKVGDELYYSLDTTSGEETVGEIRAIVTAVNSDGLVSAIQITRCELKYNKLNESDTDLGEFRKFVGDLKKDVGGEPTTVLTLTIDIKDLNPTTIKTAVTEIGTTALKPVAPVSITRYMVTGSSGSLIRPQIETTSIPYNYYFESYGVNPSSAMGGVKLGRGSTGFFDDADMSLIEFKWRYSELLVKAFRGAIDPRIMSPVRCPAKYLFDGAFNTIVGQAILPNVVYKPVDIVNSATMYTEEEREAVLYDPSIMDFVHTYDTTNDIDVKQAMYDLMIYRCYYGLPEDKRPIGPGFGLSVHFDSGITDFTTAQLVNNSFKRRFDNPNASWDIGGYTANNGVTYTYTKWIVDHLIEHCKNTTVNKPFVMSYATIPSTEYVSFYPDLDVTDWDLRELLYESGGNSWVPDINGNLVRRSQRTMFSENETSDLLQESNMRTLSQLCYLLQNMIEGSLYSYTDDGVLQTMTDMCNNRFSAWAGNLVDTLDISFERDINPTDGADIVVCYCNVTFRGLFLRVPIIVNVNRRAQ